MSLWETRERAQSALATELQPEKRILQDAFDAVDEGAERLEGVDQPFARVAALVVIKARNLALGCYTLSLDALAQEAGAILRPLLEALELLRYLRLDPARVEEALDARLPKAGVIAQRIDGEFKALREHLNVHASHVSLGPDAIVHLIDFKGGRLKLVQPFSKAVLRRNFHLLFALFVRVAIEAANCVSVAEGEVDLNLADRVDAIKNGGLTVMGIDASRKG